MFPSSAVVPIRDPATGFPAAGYGVFDGTAFEAYPGMGDATADYMESLFGDDD
ncbi:hypothetical protein [Streptomyces sp. NPDC002845]